MTIINDGKNPYLNNSSVIKSYPSKYVEYKEKLYTEYSYKLKITSFLERLIKLTLVVALSIFSCFLALAFQHFRKLCKDTIKGVKHNRVLMPQSFFESPDIAELIAYNLSYEDLIALKATSTQNYKTINPKKILVDRLNDGTMTLYPDLNIRSVKKLIAFFGNDCANITTLNLDNGPQYHFENLRDSDIKEISENFPKINHIVLRYARITDESGKYFAKMPLTQLSLHGCDIRDFSFLQHCPNITQLGLISYSDINDFSFLQHCPNITYLDLSGHRQIQYINFLQHCPKITHLDLNFCDHLNCISFLQHCPKITHLDLSFCGQLNDISFLERCPEITHLNLGRCFEVRKFSFLQHCLKITQLDLSCCTQINDFSFLTHLPNLAQLDLSFCTQIKDFSFLQDCFNLKKLYLSSDMQISPQAKDIRNRGVQVMFDESYK